MYYQGWPPATGHGRGARGIDVLYVGANDMSAFLVTGSGSHVVR
jgi:hypothetical protein